MQKEILTEQYRKEFKQIIEECIRSCKLEFDEEAENAKNIFEFSRTGFGKGKIVYTSFSDEDLCKILQIKAKELGYVPAQKELHWLYRVYIKKRFGNWPKALLVAGLSKKAGKCGDSYEKIKINKQMEIQMLEQLRQKAKEFGRPPHMHEMKEIAARLKNRFKTWAEVLEAAGIDTQWKNCKPVYKVNILSEEDQKLLNDIHHKAVELGRAPMRSEIDFEVRQKLKESCGTWRNILYQIDLEPIQKIKPFSTTYLDGKKNGNLKHNEILEGSIFKLINPNEETVNQIIYLKSFYNKLGRAPIKAEIPKNIYYNLIKQCISYRNILFQIEVEPIEKVQEKEIEKELRRRANKNT